MDVGDIIAGMSTGAASAHAALLALGSDWRFVAGATVLVFGSVALDRLYLRYVDRIDDPKATRRRRALIDRMIARGITPTPPVPAPGVSSAAATTIARVRGCLAPPGVRESAAGVRAAHPDGGACESRVLPQPPPGPRADADTAPRAPTLISKADTWAAPETAARVPPGAFVSGAHVQMGAGQQMAEFLAFVRDSELGLDIATGRYRVTRTGPAWVRVYQRWANARAIVPVPELTVLRLLSELAKGPAAAASGVEKSRERIKDPRTGAVLRNARGTPLRENVYTIYDAPKLAEPVAVRVRPMKRAA